MAVKKVTCYKVKALVQIKHDDKVYPVGDEIIIEKKEDKELLVKHGYVELVGEVKVPLIEEEKEEEETTEE